MSVLLPNGARIEMRVTEASFPWVLKQVGALPQGKFAQATNSN
jgi:hypothetical protein